MKLSVAIADANALPSAFVVFKGFEENIPKAAKLGFQGVELALKRAGELDLPRIRRLLDEHELEVSCISTGQVFADGGLTLTHERPRERERAKEVFREFIDLASGFGNIVNIGRVRGPIGNRDAKEVEELFAEVAGDLCRYALPKGVTLILEPVNRYEIDFINSLEEGVRLISKIGIPNMMLMPDVFHMNIEDRAIGPELRRNIHAVKYIHLADSNRLAPGQGHLDFNDIFYHLQKAGYDGWVAVEILPVPDPETAATQAADFLLPFIRDYNERLAGGKGAQ